VIGENLGSYRIISQLGAGAMGEVYLAEHRYLKRKAALKLLAPTLVDRPELLERFFLEARATSAIAHPGIVQIFDCEVDAKGRPYIVMEYLTGETLAARLARTRPLPAATAARLARAMAEALEAAHAKGIVHRDLKPENIFVEETPADTIKLVDFGIAKLAGDFRAEQVHQTRSGSMMGTPLYMSPEQCRDSAKLDFRTDLYSLGCVLFEMLTGRPPFTQRALGELIVAHLTEQPQDVRALNPTAPTALAELCAALLQKEPAARPAHMREVVDRLNQFSATATTVGGPPVALATSTAPPLPTPAPPHSTTLGASAVGLGAAAPAPVTLVTGGRSRVFLGAGALVVVVGVVAIVATRRGGAPAPVSGTAPVVAASLVAGPKPMPGPHPPAHVDPPSDDAPPVTDGDNDNKNKNKKAVARGHATGKNPAAVPGEHRGKTAPDQKDPGETEQPATDPGPSAPASVSGTWEGPWHDPDKHQKGRFFLQLGDDGSANGWMFNTAASESFRMVGRATPGGSIELQCQCPAARTFTARGDLRVDGQGQLVGKLGLSTAAGAFGESHLSLKRKPGR
jgi:serine/threonine-protein kinase